MRPEKHEIPELVERVLILDLDLTILRSYDFFTAFTDYCINHAKPHECKKIAAVLQQMSTRKGTLYDPFDALLDEYSDPNCLTSVDPRRFVPGFKAYCTQQELDFLQPGSRELIYAASAHNTLVYFMTSGGIMAQEIKLDCIDLLDLPREIITDLELAKSTELVGRWQPEGQNGGHFKLKPQNAAAINARRLIVVDDRGLHLEVSSNNYKLPLQRVRYMGPGIPYKTLDQPTPPGVHEVKSHHQLMQWLGWDS